MYDQPDFKVEREVSGQEPDEISIAFLAFAASPVVTVFREMLELRYLWQRSVRLDNAKLVRFLGAEPHTPIDAAVRTTLVGLGCLPDGDRVRPAAEAGAQASATR